MKISDKELTKLQTSMNKINTLKDVLANVQDHHRDLLDVIGDRYGVNLLDGSYTLASDGSIIQNKKEQELLCENEE